MKKFLIAAATLATAVSATAPAAAQWYPQQSQYGYVSQYGTGYNQYGYTDRDHDGRDDGQEHQRWHNNHAGDRDDNDD